MDVELHAADRERLLQRATHALCGLLGGRGRLGEDPGRSRHQQEELVAAVAADDVAGSGGAAQALGDGGEQLVAGLVAEAVVHELEVVEIDVEDGRPLGRSARARMSASSSRLRNWSRLGRPVSGIVIGAMDQVVLGDACCR